MRWQFCNTLQRREGGKEEVVSHSLLVGRVGSRTATTTDCVGLKTDSQHRLNGMCEYSEANYLLSSHNDGTLKHIGEEGATRGEHSKDHTDTKAVCQFQKTLTDGERARGSDSLLYSSRFLGNPPKKAFYTVNSI